MEKNHTCMKIKETKKDHYPYTPQRKQEKKQTEPLTGLKQMIQVISILKHLGKKTNKGKKKATLLQKALSIVFKMFDRNAGYIYAEGLQEW